MELLEYGDYLRRTQPDWESRWENVQELITFASEVEGGSMDELDSEETITEDEVKSASHFINLKVSRSCINRETPLRLFLQASMLSSEGESQHEDNNREVFSRITSLSYLIPYILESNNLDLSCCKRPRVACGDGSCWYTPCYCCPLYIELYHSRGWNFPFLSDRRHRRGEVNAALF